MEEGINAQKSKVNVAIYKKYKLFSYDLLFYYAIEVLFFTIVKKFSVADIMYLSSIYTISGFFWQLIGGNIVEKLGLKKSIVSGNIFVVFSIFLYIISNTFYMYAIANFFLALGYSLKSLSEGSLLYTSLKKLDRRKEFAKIEGISNAKYYYFDAISSVLSGFLFVVNGYLPFILSFVCALISLIISFKFKDLKEEKDYEESLSLKETLRATKEVVSSKRSKAILIFAFAFWGMISVVNTLYKAIVLDIGIKEEYSTIIVAIVTIFVGLGARCANGIEKRLKNKTLTMFVYFFFISSIMLGILGIYSKLNLTTLSFILISLCIIGIVQGAYRVAIKKYVLSFTNHNIRIKITSAYYVFENLGKSITLFVSGLMLEIMNNSVTCLVFSLLSFVIMILVLNYLKGKLGLKPEEYSKRDINYTKI